MIITKQEWCWATSPLLSPQTLMRLWHTRIDADECVTPNENSKTEYGYLESLALDSPAESGTYVLSQIRFWWFNSLWQFLIFGRGVMAMHRLFTMIIIVECGCTGQVLVLDWTLVIGDWGGISTRKSTFLLESLKFVLFLRSRHLPLPWDEF